MRMSAKSLGVRVRGRGRGRVRVGDRIRVRVRAKLTVRMSAKSTLMSWREVISEETPAMAWRTWEI